MDDDPRPEDVVLAYHERTKHHHFRYAAGPGYLDWESQPDPFRRYADAPLTRLPLPPAGNLLPYGNLYLAGAVATAPLDLASISQFLRYALSLTAWKQIESSRWALRANPSSGNLHPTEGYLILSAVGDLHDRAAVYHYAAREHGLERRAEIDDDALRLLTGGLPGAFLAGLSSVHWREAWKYGERAYRYCQHDVGHALGALRISAAALGWRLHLLDRASDQAIASLLGLDRDDGDDHAEREHPDLLAIVTTAAEGPAGLHPQVDDRTVQAVRTANWCGRANTLSPLHNATWPIIDTVAAAAEHRSTGDDLAADSFAAFPITQALAGGNPPVSAHTAEQIILGRRSAVAMDASTHLSANNFYRMLARVMPSAGNTTMPWDAIPWRPRIHLALFVHRVTGLEPGLYALARDPDKADLLRTAMANQFTWVRPDACPPGLPLFRLRTDDVRHLAAQVSCGQEIAGAGAFSLGMLAELQAGIAHFGPSFYRRLFWEAGLVGQVLYLEAEDCDIRATGIGCYFDDHVHEVFGITGHEIQSLYHFTVGTPVEDQRLRTLPVYPDRA